MEDRFNKDLQFPLPEDADYWLLADLFSERIKNALIDPHGEVIPYQVWVAEPGGSDFRRNDFTEAREALEMHDFDLAEISFTVQAKYLNNSQREAFATV